MMTDTKTLPPDTDEQPPQPKTKRLDMSGTQLVGGALAAMTAAVIGAQLGVAGTVLGAAIGSVVAGTAGSLYTASLKHTKTKIASAFIGRVGDTPVQITLHRAHPRRAHHGRRLARHHPADGGGRSGLPRPGGHRRRDRPGRPSRRTRALEADPGRHGGRLPAGDRRHHRLRADHGTVRLRWSGHHDQPGRRRSLRRLGHPTPGSLHRHLDGADHRALGPTEHRAQHRTVERTDPACGSVRGAEPERGAHDEQSEPTASASPSTAASAEPEVGSDDTGTTGGWSTPHSRLRGCGSTRGVVCGHPHAGRLD